MRNPLNKRIPRDFKKNFLKYAGMIIILICTIAVGSSFQSTLNSAKEYLDKIKDNNLQEDGFIEVANSLSSDIIKHLDSMGIEAHENFYVTENEFTDASKVLLFNERKGIDLPTVFEGELPKNDSEIAIDHVFARNRGISIGDTISLLGRDYLICGTVSLPDYSALFMNNTDLMMNTNHFCVSVLSVEGFNKTDKSGITYRYSYRFSDRSLTKKEKTELEEDAYRYLLSCQIQIQEMLNREQNQSISFLELDIGSDGPFMTVFVYMFVAMIAFIFAILTNNTIESESVIIGTLRSLGFSKREIIIHYLKPTLIVALTGSALGNLIGYTLMIGPFIRIYNTTYSIGPLDIKFDIPTFLLTTILPVVIMVIINIAMLAKKLSLSPLKFLRKDLKKKGNKRSIKLPDWSFLSRFRARVILQNKGSYIMLFFGILFSSFLLMFGIGLEPLMEHYTDNINKSLPYNYQYILKAPADSDGGEKLFIYEMETWFGLGKKDISVGCYGIDKNSHYFKEAYTSDGIAVSSALANKLNLNEGDILKLKDKALETEHSLKINKVIEYDADMTVFIDKATLQKLAGKESESINCILSDQKQNIDEKYLAKVISREDKLGAARQMLDSFSTILSFINIFSVVVYIIIMYIMTKVVIEKNAVPIAYMKVFGYEPDEIRKLYLTATTIVVTISLFICIPLEILLFKEVLVFLSSMIDGYVSFYLPIRVYIEIVVIGLVAYLLINTVHINAVKKIPMTDALKNRE